MGFFDKIKKIGIFNGFSQLDDDVKSISPQ